MKKKKTIALVTQKERTRGTAFAPRINDAIPAVVPVKFRTAHDTNRGVIDKL